MSTRKNYYAGDGADGYCLDHKVQAELQVDNVMENVSFGDMSIFAQTLHAASVADNIRSIFKHKKLTDALAQHSYTQ